MTVKMRRNFSGDWNSYLAGDGTWRIKSGAPHGTQIIVIGANPNSVRAHGTVLQDLALEWREPGVLLRVTSAMRAATLEARGAMVHEAAPNLYVTLPLAKFDARAQRFWRRVFLLVRIPGGQRLLGMLAHASRNKP